MYLQSQLAQITQYLDEPWQVVPTEAAYGRAELVAGVAKIIVIDKDGRYKFLGGHPNRPEGVSVYHRPSPMITVAKSRQPESIAKDLQRRFMPDYRTYLKDVLDFYQRESNQLQRQEMNARMMTEIGGGIVRSSMIYGQDWTAQVSAGNTCDFYRLEFRTLDREEAAELLSLFMSMRKST